MSHLRKSLRLPSYDYSSPGFYFVTICTKNRTPHFGEIINNHMILNRYGMIARECWLDLPNHYHNCRLDKFVIMPNHIHGIMQIDNVGNGLEPFPIPCQKSRTHGLSEFIRAFKTFSSRRINQHLRMATDHKMHRPLFQWQKSFYDHIIRNEKSLHKIRQYIVQNPFGWEKDEYHPGL